MQVKSVFPSARAGFRLRPFVLSCLFAILPSCFPGWGAVTPPNPEFRDEAGNVGHRLSNLNVRAFCQDSLGYLWIATFRGLNRYNGYEFIHYFHDENDTLSLDNDFIFSLFLDSSHRLWIGTATGTNRYDFETNTFRRYPSTKGAAYTCSFFEDHSRRIWAATSAGAGWVDTLQQQVIMDSAESPFFSFIAEDETRRLWAGTLDSAGLAYRTGSPSWKYLALPGKRHATCLYRDMQGVWWLGTNAGIVLFDPAKQTFGNPPEECLQKRLSNTHVNFICEISPLKLLIGTESQGVFLYDIPSQKLSHNEPQQIGVAGSDQLLSCFVDRQDNVWTGSFDRGFAVWKRRLDCFNTDARLSDGFRDRFVTRILEDAFGNLWISTRYHGLFHCTPQGRLTRYDTGNSTLFRDNTCLIESLFIDSENRIWIGLNSELLRCSFTGDGQLTVRERINIKGTVVMAQDRTGTLWAGAVTGLYRLTAGPGQTEAELVYKSNVPDICVLSSGNIIFSSYGEGVFNIPSEGGLPEKMILPSEAAQAVAGNCITLFEDARRNLWMGSYGKGMLRLAGKECSVYTRRNGLPSNDVLCFREDRAGDIWMSTSYGISRLRAADSVFVNYFDDDGTAGNQFHEKAGLVHSDGRIFFTGNHGLTFFDPAAVLPNKYPPQIRLEDLKIMNRSVKPAPGGSILEKSIAFTQHITLEHKHSVVSFDYSGVDFLAPQKLTYAYRLDGFDRDWNHVGNFRRATYSNLAPGEYTFMVKAINGDGVESLHPATLHITVKPAPWLSRQAILLYLTVLTAGIFLLFRLRLRMKLSRQLLEMEQSERERERQVAEMKMTFFTNISHELRTPLTLISAPLEHLLARKPPQDPDRQLLSAMSRNVRRLLRLMNQLLDFRKMERGILALRVTWTDIVPHIRSVCEAFDYPAAEKQVTLTFEPCTPCREMWTDTDKLEKILHNLLSNALKYTPSGGSVDIFTRELTARQAKDRYAELKDMNCETYLEITVSDTGVGIPPDRMGELFVQYRRIEGPAGAFPDYGGSGIGLYYVKRLAEAHGGAITASLQTEGGMAFSFILPLNDIYSEDEKDTRTPDILPGEECMNRADTAAASSPAEHPYTILIVEDNAELTAFIRTMLEGQYRLLCAADGDRAWDIALNEAPDLILSDVLMPGISGYLLCSQVKQHPQLCHIPVILLTAKTSVSDQIEGLEQGADAYICKPFHTGYLLLTIANLLKSRETLRHYFSLPQNGRDREEVPVNLNEIDRAFLNKLTLLLEKELSNSELNINSIARELGFSRTGFYRKLKGLMDISPLDFLRKYRLKRAAEMILEGSLSLNEVAERTGFGTYSHFSVTFKKHYSISPKDYGQKT